MRLHPLLAALNRHPTFRSLVEALHTPALRQAQDERTIQVLSAITPARAYALAALHAALQRPMLVVTGRPSEARMYANELRGWTSAPGRSCGSR